MDHLYLRNLMKLTKRPSTKQKSDLIQKDPVTCARSFEHMVQLFIKEVFKSNLIPIGEIVPVVRLILQG